MLLAELFPYANVVYNILVVLYALSVLAVIVVILSENRNPVKSIAWVMVRLLLPIVGLLIYLVFGRSLKGMSLISRADLRELRRMNDFPKTIEVPDELGDESRQLISLVGKLAEPHMFTGNDIEVFTTGKDKFEAMLRDIEAATQYIHVQYFIIENDETGRRLIDLLMRKAREGVQVRVLYDYVGSFYFSPRVLKRMREAGIAVHPFLELTFTQFAFRINWRNHRKIVVIDGSVGYVGGMNIANRYVVGDRKWQPWRDTHLRVHGESVAALEYSFAIDWNYTTPPRPCVTVSLRQATTTSCRCWVADPPTDGTTSRWSSSRPSRSPNAKSISRRLISCRVTPCSRRCRVRHWQALTSGS